MTYFDTIYVAGGAAGVLSKQLFRANGMYDPDQSGSGHQPSGYDNWSSFYNHSIVLSSKIKVNFSSIAAASGTWNTWCAIALRSGTGDPSPLTPSHVVELGDTKYGIIQASNSDGLNLTNTFNCKKFFNVKNPEDNWAVLGETMSSTSPSDDAYFCCYFGNVYSSAATNAMVLTVQIEYEAVLLEPKDLAQS